jgi:hypothetical protein
VEEPPKPAGFVSLKSITQGQPDAASALADIRRIYFKTTKQTIEHDFAHAIELLKSLPTEDEREKATVFMEGLAEMRKEWAAVKRGPRAGGTEGTGAGKTGRTGTEKTGTTGTENTGRTVSQTGKRGERGRTEKKTK